MPLYNIPGILSTHGEDDQAIVQVGRIVKGEKVEKTAKNGKTFGIPKNLDYFKVVIREDLPELQAAFLDAVKDTQPRRIRVQLAYPSIEDSWFAWRTIYKSGGMLGLNDNVWWNYLRDPSTNDVLVSDYIVTPAGISKILDLSQEASQINGFILGDLARAFNDYMVTYHVTGLPLPSSWQKVKIMLERATIDQPLYCLHFDPEIPIYRTEKDEYFSEPEGRLMVTMPHLPGFTSFQFFQFKTGSVHDIRTISGNLANIILQARTFDSDLGSIPLDAIPMILVRRKETISKMIDGKLTRSPEWLVHLETLPEWQRYVDQMRIRRAVYLMQAKLEQPLGGLSTTLLPEQTSPDDLIDTIETSQYSSFEDYGIDEPVQSFTHVLPSSPAVDESLNESDIIFPELSQPDTEPQTITDDNKGLDGMTPMPPAMLPKDAKLAALEAAKLKLQSSNKITTTEFWVHVYALGYTQKSAEKFLTSKDWNKCLKAVVEDFEKNYV